MSAEPHREFVDVGKTMDFSLRRHWQVLEDEDVHGTRHKIGHR